MGDTLYNNFMYPEGVKAMGEAVQMIAEERAPSIKQPEVGATYDAFLNKPELCEVDLNQPAEKIHNFIRGLDSSPGAWTVLDGKETKLFNSRLWYGDMENGKERREKKREEKRGTKEARREKREERRE